MGQSEANPQPAEDASRTADFAATASQRIAELALANRLSSEHTRVLVHIIIDGTSTARRMANQPGQTPLSALQILQEIQERHLIDHAAQGHCPNQDTSWYLTERGEEAARSLLRPPDHHPTVSPPTSPDRVTRMVATALRDKDHPPGSCPTTQA